MKSFKYLTLIIACAVSIVFISYHHAIASDFFYRIGNIIIGYGYIPGHDLYGVTWQQNTADVNGDGVIDNNDKVSWQEANNYCDSLSFSGSDFWYLPNLAGELNLIVDIEQSPPIRHGFQVVPSVYWSSTDGNSSSNAMVINFDGNSSHPIEYLDKVNGRAYVRCIHEGDDAFLGGFPQPSFYAHPSLKTAENLVILVHGWRSDPNAWATQLKNDITQKITDAKNAGRLNANSSWSVVAYDWHTAADTLFPNTAWVKAYEEGRHLAKQLIENNNLKFIHFIAHSAGSRVIHVAARELKKNHPSIIIHSTFLDAYSALAPYTDYGQKYGKYTDWSEQYVDSRTVALDFLDTTDTVYSRLTNFNVTFLDPSNHHELTSLAKWQAYHGWPITYYRNTINDNSCQPVNSKGTNGFALSFESGNWGTTANSWKNAIKQTYSCDSSFCGNYIANSACLITQSESRSHLAEPSVQYLAPVGTEISPTGTVYTHNNNFYEAITGSPVWIKNNYHFNEKKNVLEFEYEFQSSAEGLLSVFIDNKAIFILDERLVSPGIHKIKNIPLLDSSNPGNHVLAFRLDRFTNKQSHIIIKNIKFGKFVPVSNFPWGMFRAAMSGGKTPPSPSTCDPHHLYLCATSGTCTAAGGYWYNNFCNMKPETPPVPTVTSAGQVWMDRNLGASRVATSSTDELAYGDLYQWGRGTDGHEKRTSSITSTNSNSDAPGHGQFITVAESPSDWRTPQNNHLWQGVNGINNPCPSGFRLPTKSEWDHEISSWVSNDAAGGFSSPLKLVVGGYRHHVDGNIGLAGNNGRYWTSTVYSASSYILELGIDNAYTRTYVHAGGNTVRCIKE